MILEKVSPTDVEGFDPRTTFGCPAKFHFKTVQGIPEPGNKSTILGDEVHGQCENTLVTGLNSLGKIAEPGLWFLEKVRPHIARFDPSKYEGLKFKHVDVEAGDGEEVLVGLGVEMKFGRTSGYTLEGLPVTGRIDLLLEYARAHANAPLVRQVHDHKTSSNVDEYGKSADDLLTNHQTSIYLDFCRFKFGWGKSENEMLRMSHGYFQTKGKKLFKPVETFVTIPQLEKQLADTKSVIRSMVHVAAEPDIRKVDKNLRACDVGFGCPHKNRCPRGVSAMQNLLSRFKKTTAPAAAPAAPPAPAPAAPPKPAAPPPAAVKAPDAPASNPATAAQPPKTTAGGRPLKTLQVDPSVKAAAPAPAAPPPAPAEEEQAMLTEVNGSEEQPTEAPAPAAPKKGPGRPPGSPNKPKSDLPAGVRVSIRHGLTVNMGNRNFAKVEVEVEMTDAKSKEDLAKELGEFARAEVDRQLGEYAAAMDEAKS